MKNYLNSYKLQIEIKSPVFIGDGTKIGNREYIFLQRQQKVIISSLQRLYNMVYENGLASEFQRFMMGEKYPLGKWLQEKGFTAADFEKIKRYELDAGDFFIPYDNDSNRSRPPKDIAVFIKDPYGYPYIPGSTLKGVIRSALMVHIIRSNPNRFSGILNTIAHDFERQGKGKGFLQKATSELEAAAFNTLLRDDSHPTDAVNSIMSGLVIGDSKSLSIRQLTLCQKIDLTLDGQEKSLPILRECLKPSATVEFQLTIDKTLFPFDIETIQKALDDYNAVYFENFGKKFHRGDPQDGILWIGGGAGYATKTVTYALFSHKDAMNIVNQAFYNGLGAKIYEEHHHNKDSARGIAPHTYKCTHYQGHLYDMGMSKLHSIEPV